MAFAGDRDRLGNRFPVTNARLVDFDVEVEVAEQSILDDLQMQFAHSGNQRLPGFFVILGFESWILPFEHFQRFVELFPFGGRIWFDRHLDNRLRKLDGFQQNRRFGIAERVAGDGIARADHAHDIAGADTWEFDLRDLRLLATICHSWATFSFLSFAWAKHARVFLELA